MELTAGGRVRRFALRQPRSRSNGGFPLVIVLHGNHPDATGLMMRDWTTFDEQADTFGFAVAYPDGVGGCRPACATRGPPSLVLGARCRAAAIVAIAKAAESGS